MLDLTYLGVLPVWERVVMVMSAAPGWLDVGGGVRTGQWFSGSGWEGRAAAAVTATSALKPAPVWMGDVGGC